MKQNLLTTLLITSLFILSNNAFAQININATTSIIPCYGDNSGTIDITVTGGTPPYTTYNWETTNGSGLINGQEDQNELTAGTYNLTVTDSNSDSETWTGTIYQTGGPISVFAMVIDNDCIGSGCSGSASAFGSGGTGMYIFNWSNGQINDTANGLCAGTYSVTINDISCPNLIDTTTIIIDETGSANIDISINSIINADNGICDGQIDLTITGDALPLTYNWSTGDTTEDLNNLCAGYYSITVTDTNNCQVNDTYIIENDYDSTITTFVDTVTIVIDTCLFNTSLPIDSASIYDFEIISVDSAITNWVFWQAGTAIYLDVTVPYVSGTNLIYLQIVCLSKATNTYKFYGVFNSTAVGVQEVRILPSFKLYPNPAKNNVQITMYNEQLGSTVQIININGEVVKQFNPENIGTKLNIQVADLAKGIYFVKLTTANGVSTQKLVLE